MAFTDRVVEYPGRVTLTDASDSSVLGTFDVTRDEGVVTDPGTPLNAANLNAEIQGMIDTAISALTIDGNGNVAVRNMQSGRVNITPTAAKTVTSLNVTFPRAFTKTPFVTVSPITAGPNIVAVSVGSVTTTGFTMYLYRTTKVQTGINWIAHV